MGGAMEGDVTLDQLHSEARESCSNERHANGSHGAHADGNANASPPPLSKGFSALFGKVAATPPANSSGAPAPTPTPVPPLKDLPPHERAGLLAKTVRASTPRTEPPAGGLLRSAVTCRYAPLRATRWRAPQVRRYAP